MIVGLVHTGFERADGAFIESIPTSVLRKRSLAAMLDGSLPGFLKGHLRVSRFGETTPIEPICKEPLAKRRHFDASN
jgi:hypothetical protein